MAELRFIQDFPAKGVKFIDISPKLTDKDDFKAMSWTLDYDKAEWFANRFGTDGYILEATINKNDIVAFFDVRGESEVVVDYNKLKNITYELVKNIKL